MEHIGGQILKKEIDLLENIKTTYTTILHQVREDLKISITEYCVADIIHCLSGGVKSRQLGGWCYASKQTLGNSLGVDKKTVQRAINKLIELNLLEKDSETKYLRTTEKWFKAVEIRRAKISGNIR